MITLEEAKKLRIGQILHHIYHRNADKTPMRWRVSGKVKTWKRSPNRIEVPMKHGLYLHRRWSFWELSVLRLTAAEANQERAKRHTRKSRPI